jgi:hypothetical protein
MTSGKKLNSFKLSATTLGLLTLFIVAVPVSAQYEIAVNVSNTLVCPNTKNEIVTVYVDNFFDTIVAFNLELKVDPPGRAVFRTDSGIFIDTSYWDCVTWGPGGPPDPANCIDSIRVALEDPIIHDWMNVDTIPILIGSFDTVGTLIGGWEYVQTRSSNDEGKNLIIAGIANLPDGGFTPGFSPQQGGPLINLLVDILDVHDTIVTLPRPIHRGRSGNILTIMTPMAGVAQTG